MKSSRLYLHTTALVYWEMASLFFSFLSIVVVLLLLFEHRPSTTSLLIAADLLACLIFATEFIGSYCAQK